MNRQTERVIKLAGLPRDFEREPAGGATMFDRWLLRLLVAPLKQPPFAVALWDGTEEPGSRRAPLARVRILDRGALLRLLVNPLLHFGDMYSAGRVEVDGDLRACLEAITAAIVEGRRERESLWWRIWRDQAPRSTKPHAARDNIHHHYDLGNAFYRLWLDREAMQYTCAYYPEESLSLEQAQRAKMDLVCRKLRLRPGQRVVEAGCGWGGFALHMARHYGVSVRAFNISREQVRHAREWARASRLDDRVEFVEDDYRNIRGEYDAFVSIGMLEHVGVSHYRELGAVIDRCLGPRGLGLLHSIGRNQPGNMNAWIERRIFPGAYPPSLREMMGVFEPFAFSILDVENLRLHYVRTLEDWSERFETETDRLRVLYDEAFVRAWRLYLAGSIAAFAAGSLQLFQVLFARERNDAIPRSRRDIYT